MWPNHTKKLVLLALLLAGFATGIWHHRLGVRAIFVFKGNEPVFTWIAMIAGPLSTLPATVASIFNRKIGGYWLVGGGFLSLLSISVGGELTTEQIGQWFVMMSAPMLAIGAGFLLLMKWSASKPENVPEGK